MATNIQRDVIIPILKSCYIIMIDQTTDLANLEQLVFDGLTNSKDLIGMRSDDFVKVIKELLLRLDLDISQCRGRVFNNERINY